MIQDGYEAGAGRLGQGWMKGRTCPPNQGADLGEHKEGCPGVEDVSP